LTFDSGDSLPLSLPARAPYTTLFRSSFISSGEIDYQFDDGGSAGNWSVRVNSPDGARHSGFTSFTVAAALLTPSLTSVSPTSYPADTSLHTIHLFCSNFDAGDTLTFT